MRFPSQRCLQRSACLKNTNKVSLVSKIHTHQQLPKQHFHDKPESPWNRCVQDGTRGSTTTELIRLYLYRTITSGWKSTIGLSESQLDWVDKGFSYNINNHFETHTNDDDLFKTCLCWKLHDKNIDGSLASWRWQHAQYLTARSVGVPKVLIDDRWRQKLALL